MTLRAPYVLNDVTKAALGLSIPPGTAATIPHITTPTPKPPQPQQPQPSDAQRAGEIIAQKGREKNWGPNEAINNQ